jgi:hypothetical protein
VEITEAKTKEWLKLEVSHDFDLLKLAWIQLWDVDDFTGFPKSSKSSKSEFGAKSYAHNTNLDCGKKLQQHKTVVHKRSDVQNLLKLAWFQLWVVENFISFSKSTRSSKSKFGAKSYGQNTTSILFCLRGPVRHRTDPIWRSSAPIQKLQRLPLTASTHGGPLRRSGAPQKAA